MSKILSIIGRKKELLERKVGKKQNRLIPNYLALILGFASDLCKNKYIILIATGL